MKILQISKLYYPWIGGVEKIVQQISENLKDDFNISVLCCRPKGRTKREKINGVRVIKTSSLGLFWGMPFSFSFLRLFRKMRNNFDLIDYHYPFPLADLAIFLFQPKGKLVVHYHADIVRQKILNFLINPLTFNTLERADLIIVSNPNIIKSSLYLRNFQDKCKVVPFGVDLEEFQKPDKVKVKEIKKNYGDFVLFVGRLSYYKGVEYLIKAIKDLDVNLVIIGEGEEKEFLVEEIEELNIENKVFFLSFMTKKELINFYHSCRVLVLPSIFESEAFGIVLIEAMACGKPVISTELGTGTSFVNQNRITGFVAAPQDPQELCFLIERVIHDDKKHRQMCKNALRRVEEVFNLEKVIEQTKNTYNNILSNNEQENREN